MTETQFHKAVVSYLSALKLRCFWFHVPNTHSGGVRWGAKLKSMGLRAGVADLVFFLPGGKAVCMELKTPKGRLSDSQKEFRESCSDLGVGYVVCRSMEDVEEALRGWKLI